MAISLRQKIINAVNDRLANYQWQQWGPEVFTGRTIFDPDQDSLPVLTIVPGVEESERTRYRTDYITMPVEISGLVSLDDGADVYEICEPIFAEIRKAIFDGGQIEIGDDHYDITYRGGGIAEYPTETGPAIVTIGVSIAIEYETATGDPYN